MARTSNKHDLRDRTSARISKALETVEQETDRAVSIVSKEAKALEASKVYTAVAQFGRDVRVASSHSIAAAQHELSSAWRIVAGTVWLELLFVLLTQTHYHTKLVLGPLKWSPFPLSGQNAYSVTLPNATIWWRAAFLKPFALWIVATVLIPLIFAHLIVFPRPEAHRRVSRTRRVGHFAAASPVTFSIVRLAVGYFLLKIAPSGLTSEWAKSPAFGEMQILGSFIGLAFALAEALSV